MEEVLPDLSGRDLSYVHASSRRVGTFRNFYLVQPRYAYLGQHNRSFDLGHMIPRLLDWTGPDVTYAQATENIHTSSYLRRS